MTGDRIAEVRTQILSTVREFVKRDVIPQAALEGERTCWKQVGPTATEQSIGRKLNNGIEYLN